MIDEIQAVTLAALGMTAVLYDLRFGVIPNAVICSGMAMGLSYQAINNGLIGVLVSVGGMVLPILLLGGLFCFRMIGAGDIKLLCAVGAFLGPAQAFSCIVWAVAAGALLSAILLYRRKMIEKRFAYFWSYICDYSETGLWKPYLAGAGEEARFCFSIPVLAGILICVL